MGPKLALAPLGAARKALLLLLLIIMCDNRSMKQSCALLGHTKLEITPSIRVLVNIARGPLFICHHQIKSNE